MSKRTVLLFTLFISALIALVASLQVHADNQKQFVTVEHGNITNIVSVQGELKAEKQASLSFANVGKITTLSVTKGQLVRKNQSLATMEVSDLQNIVNQTVEDYMANVQVNQIIESSSTTNDETSALPQSTTRTQPKPIIVKSETSGRQTTAANKNLSLTSPFDGVVMQVNTVQNAWISPDTEKPLITIIDPATFYFEAEIPERDIQKIKIGQPATIVLRSYPNETFNGSITTIDKATRVNEKGITVLPVTVKLSPLSLQKDNVNLAVGLQGDAEIITSQRKNVLILPKRAVHKHDRMSAVYVQRDKNLHYVRVLTGLEDDKNVEIINGIKVNERVLPVSQ